MDFVPSLLRQVKVSIAAKGSTFFLQSRVLNISQTWSGREAPVSKVQMFGWTLHSIYETAPCWKNNQAELGSKRKNPPEKQLPQNAGLNQGCAKGHRWKGDTHLDWCDSNTPSYDPGAAV